MPICAARKSVRSGEGRRTVTNSPIGSAASISTALVQCRIRAICPQRWRWFQSGTGSAYRRHCTGSSASSSRTASTAITAMILSSNGRTSSLARAAKVPSPLASQIDQAIMPSAAAAPSCANTRHVQAGWFKPTARPSARNR